MNAIQLMRREADLAFGDLLVALEGVDDALAWAVAPLRPQEYLHNNGSILGITQHVAGCKFMYGSAAFRNLDVRWRDVVVRLEKIGSDMDATVAYLQEAHEYWVASWGGLHDEELSSGRMTNWGEEWPAWRVIATMTTHDAYHAGQIVVLKATLAGSDTPPESMVELTHEVLSGSPSW